MKTIGRIVARGDGIAGLFMPIKGSDLKGVYEVREILGELTIKRVGDPAMPDARFTGLDLDGLLNDRPYSVMTRKELESITEDKGYLWHPQLR